MFTFNNQKICLAWTLPRQIKPSFLKEKLFLIIRFFLKKTVLFLKTIGGVDRIIIWRHAWLNFYAYIYTPVVFILYDDWSATFLMFLFQFINIYYFLERSKKIKREGWVLKNIFLFFNFLTKKFGNHKIWLKTANFLSSLAILIIDPLLFVIKYERASHQKYYKNKKITMIIVVLFSALVASVSWSFLIHHTGVDTGVINWILGWFDANLENIDKTLKILKIILEGIL